MTPYLDAPTKRVCLLMAALERAERNDEGRAREWTARAVNAAPDPAWTADGYVSDRWLPASPVTGRIDAFEWRVPLTGTLSAQIIEPGIEPAPADIAAQPAPDKHRAAGCRAGNYRRRAQARLRRRKIDAKPVDAKPADTKAEPKIGDGKPEPVIPLVHAPDDPGPDAFDESEPAPSQNDNGWRKILG